MNVYRRFLHILKQRGEDLVLFEITMRAIGILVGAFVSISIPHIIKINLESLAGVPIFNPQNIFFICVLAISITVLLYLALLEIVGLCHIAHSIQRHDRPSIVATIRFSAKKALHIVHAYGLTGVLLVFIGVIIFPILNINPRLFQIFDLPLSLYKESAFPDIAGTVRTVFYITLGYVGFRSIFSFHIFASKQHSLFKSVKESWALTKLHKKPHEVLAWGVFVPIIVTVGLFLFSVILFFIGIGLINTLVNILFSVFPQHISLMLYASWVYVITAVLSVLIAPVSITTICAYVEVRMPRVLGRDSSHILERLPHHLAGWKVLHKKKNILIGGLLAFIIFALVAQYNIQVFAPIEQPPQIISHRGIDRDENTIKGFTMALEQGAEGIETDIQRLKDGTLVVFHDDSLDRLYDIDMRLRDVDRDDLQKLQVDIVFADEVIDLIVKNKKDSLREKRQCATWLLEIKSYEGSMAVVQMGSTLFEILKQKNILDCVFVGSFDQQAISDLEIMYPELQTNMYLIGQPEHVHTTKTVDAYTIEHTSIESIKPNLPSGALFFAWTVNALSDMKRVSALGVQGIITDRIDVLQTYILQSFKQDKEGRGVVRIFGKWFIIDLSTLWKFNIRYTL
ncbi:MAG: Glycerophosphoryl diester phosphodiesterase [Candidatus Parcubacteria bacterium]|jgi:glycerophosphoryl diester phosphodiesterase